MKIGILQTARGKIEQYGKFYNTQEIGLARALAQLGNSVKYYKFVESYADNCERFRRLSKDAEMIFIKAVYLGNNGLSSLGQLDKDLDALIYFSDTQLMVTSVYRWCRKNNVHFLPYIGVIESHSTSSLKRSLMYFSAKQALKIYRKGTVLAKTPLVTEQLKTSGVNEIKTVPVGLDDTLLFTDYGKADLQKIRKEFGIPDERKVILFIGRMEEEKRPFEMLDIFQEVLSKDSKYFLLMVGKGTLLPAVKEKAKAYGLEQDMILLETIENHEVWKLYCLSDVFVNLNRVEIFGMCILEAMYYGCRLVAQRAPGPDYILESGMFGAIVDGKEQTVAAIFSQESDLKRAREHVLEHFLWSATAATVYEELK